MKCKLCSNDARYLRANGWYVCGLHAMGFYALRLSDISAVLDDVYYLTLSELDLNRTRTLQFVNEAKARLRAMLGMLPQNCQTVEIRSPDDD